MTPAPVQASKVQLASLPCSAPRVHVTHVCAHRAQANGHGTQTRHHAHTQNTAALLYFSQCPLPWPAVKALHAGHHHPAQAALTPVNTASRGRAVGAPTGMGTGSCRLGSFSPKEHGEAGPGGQARSLPRLELARLPDDTATCSWDVGVRVPHSSSTRPWGFWAET